MNREICQWNNNWFHQKHTIHVKKHSRIKKQLISSKYAHLLQHYPYLLFFHYNGKKECNWQQIKGKLPFNAECKSLLIPSNLFHSMFNGQIFLPPEWGPLRFLIRGPTLLVTCSSIDQMALIVDTWKGPDLVLIGGIYDQHPHSHLDIRRWATLHHQGKKPYLDLLLSLTGGKAFYSLLQISTRFSTVSYPFHSLIEKLDWMTNADSRLTKPPDIAPSSAK